MRGTEKSAAYDLSLALPRGEAVWLGAGEIWKAPTGLAIELPPGVAGLIRPRSSAAERGYRVIEGTLDEDYRGELHVQIEVLPRTRTRGGVMFTDGDRIAQLLLVVGLHPLMVETDNLTPTARGVGGFGSTGK